jgi:membrane-associated phospholipid phosphatase
MTNAKRLLMVTFVGAAIFGVLALMVSGGGSIHRFDAACAEALYEFTAQRPGVRSFFVVVTDLGTGQPLWVVGIASTLMLLLRREWYAALAIGVGQYTCRPVVPWLKLQFERPRPPYVDWTDYSFPSGHAFGSAVIYGTLGLVLLKVWCGTRWRWVPFGLAVGFALLVALSRTMLGVHYVSDVTAGACLGFAWAAFFAALPEIRFTSAARPGQ